MLRVMSRRSIPLVSPPLTLVCVILACAVSACWTNSLSAPFLFDDHHAVLENPTIRQLWSLKTLQPPATAGETVSGRPLLNLSFALNAAIGGLSPESFRVGNLLIHYAAALLLFGITWRTLAEWSSSAAGPDLRPGRDDHPPAARFERRSDPSARPGPNEREQAAPIAAARARWFALAVALAWALHPLQTASTTYIAQRAESLAALFSLLVLYSFIRYSWPASAPARAAISGGAGVADPGAARWAITGIAAALLGAATKETIAVAPLIVLLYDRTFVSGSFRAAWHTHRRFYLGLLASWILLAVLVASNAGRGGSAGFGSDIGPWPYALTQIHAIVHYARLALWPHPLVFDYGVATVAGIGDVWIEALLLFSALAATIWAVVRNRPLGFPAAAFFLLLAPTSSVVPVATQTIAEHRMYLPLAALVLIAGLGLWCLAQRVTKPALAALIAGVVILALGATTIARNHTYRSTLAVWQDVVAKRPGNARGHHNLGIALLQQDRLDEAAAAFRRAIELQPHHAFAHYQLGTIALRERRWEDAIGHLSTAVTAEPRDVSMRIDLGHALTQVGRTAQAEQHYRAAIELDPNAHDARSNLAGVVLAQGRRDEAEAILRELVADAPGFAPAHHQLGLIHEAAGRNAAAEAAFREAHRLAPSFVAPLVALGNLAAGRGDTATAGQWYRRALELDPAHAGAHFGLGSVFAQGRRFDEAMAAFREVLRLDPEHRGARHNLGNCQLVTRDFASAAETYREILRRHPDDAVAREHLLLAEEFLRKTGQHRPLRP